MSSEKERDLCRKSGKQIFHTGRIYMLPVSFFSRATVLDCGVGRTALGVFGRKGGRLCLERFTCETAAAPATDDAVWLEQTGAALRRLGRRAPAGGPVVLVLPAHLTLSKLVRLPRADPEQRQKLVSFEAEQAIPFALSDVTWHSVLTAESEQGMEVLLAAARLDVVEPLCVAAESAGFAPDVLLPAPLATLAGFRLARPEHPECCLVLHQGLRSITLLQVEGERFSVRTFPPAGPREWIDPDDSGTIAAGSIPPAESGGPTAGAETRVKWLAGEIVRSVRYFRSKGMASQPGRVFVVPSGGDPAGRGESLATALQLPVAELSLQAQIGVTWDPVENLSPAERDQSFDLVGAAAALIRPYQTVLNLLPPSQLMRRARRRRQLWLVLAVGFFLTALVLPATQWQRQAAEVRKKTAAMERRMEPWRVRERGQQKSIRRLAQVRQQLARLDSLSNRRVGWVRLLAALQDRLNRVEDAWLEKLQLVEGAPGDPLKLAVSGFWLDRENPAGKATPASLAQAKTLLAGLAGSPLIAAVEGERFQTDRPGVLRFECVLVLRPELAL